MHFSLKRSSVRMVSVMGVAPGAMALLRDACTEPVPWRCAAYPVPASSGCWMIWPIVPNTQHAK